MYDILETGVQMSKMKGTSYAMHAPIRMEITWMLNNEGPCEKSEEKRDNNKGGCSKLKGNNNRLPLYSQPEGLRSFNCWRVEKQGQLWRLRLPISISPISDLAIQLPMLRLFLEHYCLVGLPALLCPLQRQ